MLSKGVYYLASKRSSGREKPEPLPGFLPRQSVVSLIDELDMVSFAVPGKGQD